MGTRRKAAEDKVIKQDTGSALGWSPHVNAGQSLKGCFLELLRPDSRPLSQILPSKNKSEGWICSKLELFFFFPAWLSAAVGCEVWTSTIEDMWRQERAQRGWKCRFSCTFKRVHLWWHRPFTLLIQEQIIFFTVLLSNWWHQQSPDPVWHYLECWIEDQGNNPQSFQTDPQKDV